MEKTPKIVMQIVVGLYKKNALKTTPHGACEAFVIYSILTQEL